MVRGDFKHTSICLAFCGLWGWGKGPQACAASASLNPLASPTLKMSVLLQHRNSRASEGGSTGKGTGYVGLETSIPCAEPT